MASENETIADIVAKLRRQSNEEYAFAAKLRSDDCDDVDYTRASCYDEDAKYLSQIADRIEAAWKRERVEIATTAAAQAVNLTNEKFANTPVGNAAATREALEAALPIMRNCPFTHYNTNDVDAVVSKMEFALAKPARNCDRYATAVEAMEELKRVHSWCAKGNRRCLEDCPDCGKTWCSLAWLFAAAEEGAKA